MKKFIHIPKTVSIVFFFIFITLLIMLLGVIAYRSFYPDILFDLESKKSLHEFASIMAIIVCVFALIYIDKCLEKGYKSWASDYLQGKNVRFTELGWIPAIADALLFQLCLFGFFYTVNVTAEMGEGTIAGIWYENIPFIPLIMHIFFFVGMIKNASVYRRTKRARFASDAVIKDLGFDYYSSEFYRQTGVSYAEIGHRNGTLGELEAYKNLHIYENYYGAFVFNREIPKEDGLTTEIDLIMLHPHGIVVENKDFSGTIYGRAVDYDWTMIDRSGRKIAFYNPIRQNENHVKALKDFLIKNGLYNENTPMHSVVVFTDLNSVSSDEVISRIDMAGSGSKVCTSRNLYYVVSNLLQGGKDTANVRVGDIQNLLLRLNVRKKQ